MIAAFDVHYPDRGRARAAAVLFEGYGASAADEILTRIIAEHADYIPGEFFKRELPCILALLDQFEKKPAEIIIDGYVWLDNKPGLGHHLYESLGRRIPVIGVAKSSFARADAEKVFRGRSTRPLYITAAGIPTTDAARCIGAMHGRYRIPTLLKLVDQAARGKVTRAGGDHARRQ